MGKGASKLRQPKYVKNFNIENKSIDVIDSIETGKHVKASPRHPSTVEAFKKNEEQQSGISDLEMNRNVLKSLKTVKVYSKGDENLATSNKNLDKRPKKENEGFYRGVELKIDEVFENYGYVTPEKIRAGNLTLQQFDMFINQYKKDKSVEVIKKFSEDTKIDVTTLHVFLEHYKPFLKIDGKGGKRPDNADEQLKLNTVFPNVK